MESIVETHMLLLKWTNQIRASLLPSGSLLKKAKCLLNTTALCKFSRLGERGVLFKMLFTQICLFRFSNLNTRSAEILFEVWGSVCNENEKKHFLGLGIVSLEELLITTKQAQVIPLQGGPFDDMSASLNGLLTVEFNVVGSDRAEMNESEFLHNNGCEELKSQPGLKFEGKCMIRWNVWNYQFYTGPDELNLLNNGAVPV